MDNDQSIDASLFSQVDLAQLRQEQVFVDVPYQVNVISRAECLPSGYDPMGMIYLLGQSFQHLTQGEAHWWTLWSGWVIFGGRLLLATVVAFAVAELSPAIALGLWASGVIPVLLMTEGTERKLEQD